MVEINLLIADKLWRNNNEYVIIIVWMLKQSRHSVNKVILITLLWHLKAKPQGKYEY